MKALAEVRYRLEHGKNPELISAPEEADLLIDALLTGPSRENLAQIHSLDRDLLPSGYPDHELLVGVDNEQQVGILAFMDEYGNFVTLGSPEKDGELAYFIQGHMTEFPAHSEIPIALVRQALREFIASAGKRPECVEWQEY